MKIIASCGGKDWLGPQAPVTQRVPYAFDEHYYKLPWEIELLASQYDHYDRKGPKTFVGEWAACLPHPNKNSLEAALGDAAWMTGMERNSDVVVLSCYAPLMGTVHEPSKVPVNFDGLGCFGSPSYHAQKMFATYLGNSILAVKAENIPTWTVQPPTPKAEPGQPKPKTPPPVHIPSLFQVATRDDKAARFTSRSST